jgi:hypothetical protein
VVLSGPSLFPETCVSTSCAEAGEAEAAQGHFASEPERRPVARAALPPVGTTVATALQPAPLTTPLARGSERLQAAGLAAAEVAAVRPASQATGLQRLQPPGTAGADLLLSAFAG